MSSSCKSDGNVCTSSFREEQLSVLLCMGFELEAAQAALMRTDSVENAIDHLLGSWSTQPPAPAYDVSDGIAMSLNDAVMSSEFRKSYARSDERKPTSSQASRKGKSVASKLKKRLQPLANNLVASLSVEGDSVGNTTLNLLKKQRLEDCGDCSAESFSFMNPSTQLQDSGRCSGLETSKAIAVTNIGAITSKQPLPGRNQVAGHSWKHVMSGDDVAGLDWEQRALGALENHFGHQELKPFQREALEAWAAHQDCFVVSATGSGKVVVVISPLISLMHDQCMQLARHGISACFLGSGQPDPAVERDALAGVYSLVYLCPETLIRLVGGIQELARCRGIALFAVDEAHCISKWGHDFRPDYRKLSVLRTKFTAKACALCEQVPIMALTATATSRVREDILQSLCFEKENSRVVLTTLFRPNLRFSVKHSKTMRFSSYDRDFADLIQYYNNQQTTHQNNGSSGSLTMEAERCSDATNEEEETIDDTELDEQYLEDNELDERIGGDFDVTFGQSNLQRLKEERACSERGTTCSAQDTRKGPSIVYMPTRKETVRLANYLKERGVLAKPYNAKLSRSHLRQVHEEFQAGSLQVVVATIAFGMGINKPNIRHIIHYGWPQSLEAYYQEAGRAGRDGLGSDCRLFCDMTVLPSLLPSRRDAQQTRHALEMLTECYLYGISTSSCRAKTLLRYFGEELGGGKCSMCDLCTTGSPRVEDLTTEAALLLGILSTSQGKMEFKEAADKVMSEGAKKGLPARGKIWWRGFGRILENLGYLEECQGNERAFRSKVSVPTMYVAQPSQRGLELLNNCGDYIPGAQDLANKRENVGSFPPLLVHPQGDMLQAMKELSEPTTRTAEWGRGWADPAIRAQRLASSGGRKGKRASRRKKRIKFKPATVRGRLAAKLNK